MDKPHLAALKCPKCGKKLHFNGNLSDVKEGEIVCEKGHIWPVTNDIPSLVHPPISDEDAKWISEYDEMAENYDELVKQYDDWLGIDMMKERGYEIGNIGLMLEGKRPRISVNEDRIKENLSSLVQVDKDRIGITATSGEELSAFGKGLGMQCFCVVSLNKR